MFKKIRKLMIPCIALAAFLMQSAVCVSAAVDTGAEFSSETDTWENWPAGPSIGGKTACVLDADTGVVLYGKGMDAQRYPASVTKVMTAMIVLDHTSDLNTQIAFTETGMADAYDGSSNINPQLGEVFTVDECLQMLLVKSANDVATQLAEATAGSVTAFADMMNQKALELGCTNTHFANANGLEDENHYTSAHDMALIMKAAIGYDRIREIMNAQSITIPATNLSDARTYETHVQMIQETSTYYYDGCMGGKTGYTDEAGSTLVVYAVRNGRTLIGVVMGGVDSNLICDDMAAILNYGFDNFSVADATFGYPFVSGGTVLVPNGLDLNLLNVNGTETDGNVSVTYTYDGQILGTGVMTAGDYQNFLINVKGVYPDGYVPEEEQTVQSSSVTDQTSVSASSENQAESSAKGNSAGSQKLLYAAAIVLGAAIVICVILIVATTGSRKKNKDNDGTSGAE